MRTREVRKRRRNLSENESEVSLRTGRTLGGKGHVLLC